MNKVFIDLSVRKKKPAHNTRFILFGHSASAFAKAVAPAKDVYFCFANV